MTILDRGFSFQNIIAQGTSDGARTEDVVGPHHPITCHSFLELYEDGSMTCDHSKAGPECLRNQDAIDVSIATLIIELAVKKYGGR